MPSGISRNGSNQHCGDAAQALESLLALLSAVSPLRIHGHPAAHGQEGQDRHTGQPHNNLLQAAACLLEIAMEERSRSAESSDDAA